MELTPEQIQAALREHYQRITSAGGKARAANMTPEQRTKSARRAGKASAAKRRAAKRKQI